MRPQRINAIYQCEPDLREGLGLLATELAQAGVVYEKIAQVDKPIEFTVGEKTRPTAQDASILLWDGSGNVDELLAACAAGCRVYVICPDSEAAGRLAQACAEKDLAFCGALLVPNLGKAAVLTHAPRMGFARRQVSEACDRLLYAARTGECFPGETARFRTWRR